SADTLAALEATLDQQAADALKAATDAKAAAANATALALKLKGIADSANKAALDAQQQATSARAESGLASSAAYATSKARREHDAAELSTNLDAAKATLLEVNKALKAAQPPIAVPLDPKKWRELYPSPNRVAAGVTTLKPAEEDALLRRFFPKFMKPNAQCPESWQPGMGHDNDQARAAGMFAPQVNLAAEGAFTRAGAKERLLQVRLNECTGSHVEGFGTSRWILIDGSRTLLNDEAFGLTQVGFVEDVDGDGVLDFTQVTSDTHQGSSMTDVVLSTFAGGKLHDLHNTSESDPCGAGPEMAGQDAQRIATRLLVRNSPKLEFKDVESRSRCF
ncbi:MAG: hypothetical protein ABW061_13350, partial [Polyangiaceae bacterium]